MLVAGVTTGIQSWPCTSDTFMDRGAEDDAIRNGGMIMIRWVARFMGIKDPISLT